MSARDVVAPPLARRPSMGARTSNPAAEKRPRLPQWLSPSVAVAAFYFSTFVGLGIYLPYFPLWLQAQGFVGARMSVIAALIPAMSALGPPVLGVLTDRRGARGNLAVAACALAAVTMAGLVLLEALDLADQFAPVFVLVLAYAASRPALVMLADRIALETGGSFGRRRLWGSVGFLLSATLMGRLWPRQQPAWVPALVAVSMLASACIAFVLPRRAPSARREPAGLGANPADTTPASAGVPAATTSPRFKVFLLSSFLFYISHSSYTLCSSLFFVDLGATGGEVGLLWATGVLAEVLVLGAMGRRASRLAPESLLSTGLALGVVRWLATAALTSPRAAFWVQPLHGLCFALNLTSSLEFARREGGADRVGRAQGYNMAAQNGGTVVGMLVWGPLYHAKGGVPVFLAAAALNVLAAGIDYWWLVRPARHDSASDA